LLRAALIVALGGEIVVNWVARWVQGDNPSAKPLYKGIKGSATLDKLNLYPMD